ncbi:MAG: hypothetical protein ABI421_23470 [Polyangiaceae bacterium]
MIALRSLLLMSLLVVLTHCQHDAPTQNAAPAQTMTTISSNAPVQSASPALHAASNPSAKCIGLGETRPGVPSADNACCAGLQSADIKEDFDSTCASRGAGGYAGVCLACGDGVCDSRFETKCNCPADCSVSATKKTPVRP